MLRSVVWQLVQGQEGEKMGRHGGRPSLEMDGGFGDPAT